MTPRIKILREQSCNAVNRISAERALLLTKFFRNENAPTDSIPVQRAKAFDYILSNKEICILDGELIVGERGPGPKETPTYPEICLHTTEDLDILNNRPKVSFSVDPETRTIYEKQIMPFWKGKTIRERIFQSMEPEWIDAYQSGVFTEFLEQRTPGHTVCGDKIYRMGMLEISDQIGKNIQRYTTLHEPESRRRCEEWKAMMIAAEAVIRYANRHAEMLDQLAEEETESSRKRELLDMAAVCRRVPAFEPRTFHEALQYYWFVHIGVITELNPWDSFSPGRLDQHLYPFYKRDISEGRLTRERAVELLQTFWIKFNNHPAPPKVGVTARESNTYTDFALINTGGVKTDGSDAVNELSYMILDVVEEMRLLQPSSMIQVSRENPDEFIRRALKIIQTGFGQPSIFNTDAIFQELTRQGKSIEDARNGGASGCVESGAFGAECYILTGYFNLVKILEITLNDGQDPRTGKRIGLQTGKPLDFGTWDELLKAYEKQVNHFTEIKIRGNRIIGDLYAEKMPAPFLSLLIDDCAEKGIDYNAGGARYNTSYIQGVGMGSITDCLTALRYHVFDRRRFTMNDVLSALETDFNGHTELLRQLIYETPKYGNDDDYADQHAQMVFEMFYNAVDGRPAPRGGVHRINLLPTTCHVYFGSVTGATPDGRKSGMPLSEGISPVQGADGKGPTAVIKTVSKIDHVRTGGTLLNMKFTPSFFDSPKSVPALTSLVRAYFRLNGHHVQFNVVSADTLKDAQKHPERYRDLIVRVAGYSDYFNDLGEDLQNEIIRRTEHKIV